MNEQNLRKGRTPEEMREIGAKGGKQKGINAQRRRDLAVLLNEQPIKSDDLRTVDAILLNMTNEQLKGVAENQQMPTYARRRARLLLQPDDDKAFEVSERLIDRVAGKPKQAVEADLKQAPILQVIDIGK